MELRLFDSHCHLEMEEFTADKGDVIRRAREAGVRRLLLSSYDVRSSKESLRIAKEGYPSMEIAAVVGVHPHDALGVADGLPEELTSLASNPAVAGIGETGLDFFYDNSPREEQARVFAWHIEWSLRAAKPLVIHLRNASVRASGDAWRMAFDILLAHRQCDPPGVIHCFSGNKDDAREALDLGYYLSFAGPITYPKATELREAAAYAPLERILCETDAPYLAPQRIRGKRNEPACVRDVYEKIAALRGMTMENLAEAIWENSRRLFKTGFPLQAG